MIELEKIINIATLAGDTILAAYADASKKPMPTLKTHLAAGKIICDILTALLPDVPILSEATIDQTTYKERLGWQRYWLVNPLEGAKEFLHTEDKITLNIALIENKIPVLGVICAPLIKKTYFAKQGQGAFVRDKTHSAKRLLSQSTPQTKHVPYRVVTSPTHPCDSTNVYIHQLETQGLRIERSFINSSLTFCLLAENKADCYPQCNPTLEWNTAAGQLIATEAGKQVSTLDKKTLLYYNKPTLTNPAFIVF